LFSPVPLPSLPWDTDNSLHKCARKDVLKIASEQQFEPDKEKKGKKKPTRKPTYSEDGKSETKDEKEPYKSCHCQ